MAFLPPHCLLGSSDMWTYFTPAQARIQAFLKSICPSVEPFSDFIHSSISEFMPSGAHSFIF